MTMKVAVSLLLMLVVLLTAFTFGQPILNNVSTAIAENIPGVERGSPQVQAQSSYQEYAKSIGEFGDFISELRQIETGSIEKSRMCFDYVKIPSESFFEEFSIRLVPDEDIYYVELLQSQEELGDQDVEDLLVAREEFEGLCVLRSGENNQKDHMNQLLDEVWGRSIDSPGVSVGVEFIDPLLVQDNNVFNFEEDSAVDNNMSEATQRLYSAYIQGSFDNVGLSEETQERGVTTDDSSRFEALIQGEYILRGERNTVSRGTLPTKQYLNTEGIQSKIILKNDEIALTGFGGDICLVTENNPQRSNGDGAPAIAAHDLGSAWSSLRDNAYFFTGQEKILNQEEGKYQPTVPTIIQRLPDYACRPNLQPIGSGTTGGAGGGGGGVS